MTVTRTFLDQWKPQRKDDSFDQGDPSSELAIARKSALLWVQWWLVPYLNESPLYDQPNGRCHGSCARARVTVQITEALLARTVEDVAGNVRPWPAGRFKLIKTLQDAPRSHGKVDMMHDPVGLPVAVKIMPNWWLKNGPSEFRAAYPHETEHPWRDVGLISTLNTMKFAYACDLIGVYRDQAATYFVTSLATEGDLFSWSSRAPKPGRAREETLKDIMRQICIGVRLLHEVGIAHRDLSLENILLTDAGDGKLHVKIIDYSMASIARKGVGYKHGKSAYKAPEMFRKHEYDFFLSDAFALGVVLYAMAWQRYPWKSTQPGKDEGFTHAKKFGIQSLDQNKDKSRPVSVYSTAMYGILEGLLAMEPGTRLHLGESCYRDDEAGGPVWATEWL
mmetsp:Transcript_126881/g.359041  ORF Transcript_126881/g.359041 Transcript_126881/m.359041 type:complete len:392 (-) Transcript_126881:330-1505(-)